MLPISQDVLSFNEQNKHKLPLIVLEDIKLMGDYNPRVYPPFQGCGVTYNYYNKFLDGSYAALILSVGSKSYDGVVFIPRIRTGGTDKLLKSYLYALHENHKDILIFCEDSSVSAWTEEFEGLTKIVYLDKVFCKNVTQSYIMAVLYSYLINLEPDFVWGFNSRLAYLIFCTHGKFLRNYTNIWIVAFAHWIHEVSYREFGMIHDYLSRCYGFIKYIICDNSVFVETLMRQYNLPNQMLVYLPSPNSSSVISFKPLIKRQKLRILWASGIEWNKGIMILVDIAKRLCDIKIDLIIDVFGTPKNNEGFKLLNEFKRSIANLDNINYISTFNNFANLNSGSYDAFLFTSIIEGMPNILLEVAESQTFIISSNVGGVKDLVIDGKTGYLVNNVFDVEEYVLAIRRFAALSNDDFNIMRKNMLEHYNAKYTLQNTTEILSKIMV